MSNMSYCRFGNTSNDLRDCVHAMEESVSLDELGLSSSEQQSMEMMAELCTRFIEEYNRLTD